MKDFLRCRSPKRRRGRRRPGGVSGICPARVVEGPISSSNLGKGRCTVDLVVDLATPSFAIDLEAADGLSVWGHRPRALRFTPTLPCVAPNPYVN